jgi:hypothetical protein
MYDMEAREFIHNMEAYLAHHHGTWVCKYFAAEDVELAQTCYWLEESQSMRFNKLQVWDNLMNWDTEFQVHIEKMKKWGTWMLQHQELQLRIWWAVLIICPLWTAMHLLCPTIPEVWMQG